MPRTILVMILAIVSTNIMAEWLGIAINETNTIYVEPNTIRKAGHMVKMWSLNDLKKAAASPRGRSYMSIRTQDEYDCKEGRLRTLYASLHVENMAKGEIVNIDTVPGNWRPFPPGTGNEILWKFAW